MHARENRLPQGDGSQRKEVPKISEFSALPSHHFSSKFRAHACIPFAPLSPSPKLEITVNSLLATTSRK